MFVTAELGEPLPDEKMPTTLVKEETSQAVTVLPSTTVFVLSDLLFQGAVVIIGTVGTLANGIAIFAFFYQLKKKTGGNILIVNQLTLDLISCISLTITYLTKLFDVHTSGLNAYWMCWLIDSQFFVWFGIDGSTFNLAAITIERYLKICHPLWHKVHFRQRVTYIAVTVVWVLAFVLCFSTAIPSTDVPEGVCISKIFVSNSTVNMAYGIWYFVSLYFIPISIFGVCYGRIFITIKRQQKLFPGSVSSEPVGGSAQQKQGQMKLLKIAFMLTLSYAVFWLPNQLYYLLINVSPSLGVTHHTDTYYGTVFFGFFNICTNPFIYGVKSKLVDFRQLLSRVRKSICKCSGSVTDNAHNNYGQESADNQLSIKTMPSKVKHG